MGIQHLCYVLAGLFFSADFDHVFLLFGVS